MELNLPPQIQFVSATTNKLRVNETKPKRMQRIHARNRTDS